MRRSLVERSLNDVHGRLTKARQELAVLDEQLVVINDIADDLRLRSLVSETPLAVHEHSDAQRHLDAAMRARACVGGDGRRAREAPGRATWAALTAF